MASPSAPLPSCSSRRFCDLSCPPKSTLQASSEDAGAQYFGCNGCPGSATVHRAEAFYCRGKVKADANGTFVFRTTRPGRYSARPVLHLHLKVHQEGEAGTPHTTQLYFSDDSRSDLYPEEVRAAVLADGTATIDVATPFSVGVPLLQLVETEDSKKGQQNETNNIPVNNKKKGKKDGRKGRC